uniref:Uncharacterized protein n=1 Tax=Ganoderma leucocontextum TaxID=1566825 RepID=A0A2S1WBF5_9APHY|nr:hypothetical protein [Ganoderma leucocontextum]AWJ63927.1 hypothetical protein [Ganoderma leucocontextum]
MGNTPFIDRDIFIRHRNTFYGNSIDYINYKYENDSFWDKVNYLKFLRISNFIRPELLDGQIDAVVAKAKATSCFNTYLISDRYQPILHHNHLVDKLYGYPILFNGIYDVSIYGNGLVYQPLARESKIGNNATIVLLY